MPNDQIIRPRNIPTITGLSRTTIWRLMKANKFPQTVQLSAGAVGWRMSEVQAWLDACKTVKGA